MLQAQDTHLAATGELPRELTLDTTRSDQPTRPQNPTTDRQRKNPNPSCGFGVIPMS